MIWRILFLFCALGDLISVVLPQAAPLEWVFKPLLMPILIMVLRTSLTIELRQEPYFRKLFLALAFSFGGDTFLLFQERDQLFFILGLGSFLIAHIQYILAFRLFQPSSSERKNYWLKSFPVVLVLIGYGLALYTSLFPQLDAVMKVAVAVYATAITIMALAAFGTKTQIGTLPFMLTFGGALLFVISDSLIAVNKFLAPIPQASFLIMITYIAAQWMIIEGSLKK